jgi:prophage tail gpP-like protein
MSRLIVKNAATGTELLWRHINIKKSLDNICHTLELEIPASERTKVRKHDKIEVRYENNLVKDSGGRRRVTTVMVDEITAAADVSRHGVLVIGRSPARDIIDSTWKDGLRDEEHRSLTLRGIAQHICGKFGIGCDTFPPDEPDPTGAVPVFSWDNESPWMKLVTEADAQEYILTSNEAGDLYLWPVAAANREGFILAGGRNIKSVTWTDNGAEQYHEYIVSGGFGDPVTVIDDTCGNNRVLTVNLTYPEIDQVKLKRRAETEMRRRRESRVTVTVPGWGLTDEQIKRLGDTDGKEIFWVPNILIPVSMPSIGLSDSLLIAEVEQEATPEAMSSTITLVKRSAYL